MDVAVLDGSQFAGRPVVLEEGDDGVPELGLRLRLPSTQEEHLRVGLQERLEVDLPARAVEVLYVRLREGVGHAARF